MASPEHEPEIRLEEWILTELGYGHCLDTPIAPVFTGGTVVLGRNFLDAYGESSPHRQATEDRLICFQHTDPSDPDYEGDRAYILSYMEAIFEPPETDTDPGK